MLRLPRFKSLVIISLLLFFVLFQLPVSITDADPNLLSQLKSCLSSLHGNNIQALNSDIKRIDSLYNSGDLSFSPKDGWTKRNLCGIDYWLSPRVHN